MLTAGSAGNTVRCAQRTSRDEIKRFSRSTEGEQSGATAEEPTVDAVRVMNC